MSCSLTPAVYFKMGNDIMDNPGDAKYGMTKDQITEAFTRIKGKGRKEFRHTCISLPAIL